MEHGSASWIAGGAGAVRRRDILDLIDHLKGTRPVPRGVPAEWFGSLRHLPRRVILARIRAGMRGGT